MALTATASQGFEPIGVVEEQQLMLVPGDPGDTFTRGDIVTFTGGEGVADLCAAGETPYGVVMETVECSASTVGFPHLAPNGTDLAAPADSAEAKSLITIKPLVPVGTPILRVTFASHTDIEDITAYTAGDPSITVDAIAADDDNNGGLVYVYGGVNETGALAA